MSANRDREEEIFDTARELAAAERAAYLAEKCGQDADLRQRIEEMLAADAAAGDFFKTHDARLSTVIVADTSRSPSIEKAGDRIGRYKLLQQIGEGGCGVVYMAEQEEPVRRRVALKVIKLGMDTKQVIARFEAERQALALMDHPNIARVLDAGAAETGRPYFVMELVRGTKITEFCDQKELPTRERLDLFLRVCSAVQHAHQKGIIHRDIKPSNILVTVVDGAPVPKVIDFGIAKATNNQPLTDKTVFTAFEQFIGTPAYMSPEQAELSGVDIDTRTDIYSLGVVLYELLTGSPPFDQKELLAAGLDEMRRTIREQEPPRPSTRLVTMAADAVTTTAKQHHTDAPKLIHLLRGDLDWIAMKCLEKDRARRYETANGLAADIQRHLSNEPIVARPPSQLYRFQKSLHRNKLAFAAAGAIATVLVLGVVVSMWQAIRATRAEREQVHLREAAETARENEAEQRRQADLARANEAELRAQAEVSQQKAETKAACSAQVAQFMKDMLQGVGPDVALSRFREAVADFEKLTKLDPTNQWNWYEATGLYLYVGDVERYRGACRDMLDRFEKDATDDPRIASMVAKVCALAPDSVPDFSRVERLAESCMTGTENYKDRRWFILAKGLTDYRAGHHEQAVVWLKHFGPKPDTTHWEASAFAILAMAHHRLGHADEARVSLDAARGILAKKPQDAMRDWSWRDWLHSEILCREAEALLKPDQKPKTDAAR
jgi:serine/threonine protein kinase